MKTIAYGLCIIGYKLRDVFEHNTSQPSIYYVPWTDRHTVEQEILSADAQSVVTMSIVDVATNEWKKAIDWPIRNDPELLIVGIITHAQLEERKDFLLRCAMTGHIVIVLMR